MYVCMYVCMYVFTCVIRTFSRYTLPCMYVCICVCLYVYTAFQDTYCHVCTSVCMYMNSNLRYILPCMYIRMYVCMRACIYEYNQHFKIHAAMRLRAYTHTHTQLYIVSYGVFTHMLFIFIISAYLTYT
jgi:hypothetical protein